MHNEFANLILTMQTSDIKNKWFKSLDIYTNYLLYIYSFI